MGARYAAAHDLSEVLSTEMEKALINFAIRSIYFGL
jgi:hypothetical protein